MNCSISGVICTRTVYRPEYVTGGQPGRPCPRIHRDFYPPRHWGSPDTAMLSDQIHDAPSPVTLLDMHKCERRNFGSQQTAAKKNSKNSAIS
jgi:hypothetical protein